MTKKEKIIIGGGIFILVIIIFIGMYFSLWNKKKVIPEEVIPTTPIGISPEGIKSLEEKKYTPEAPKDAVQSEPVVRAPANPHNNIQHLDFYDIAITSNGFFPNSITIKKGDLIKLRFTAKDGAYDVAIPYMELSTSIKQGETRQVSFQADGQGTFVFECQNQCPVDKKIDGVLIVVP